ncbi:MAG: YciI family protein [Methyloceanibacter sp.]
MVEAASLEAAKEISANDPFAKLGIFASVDIRPWLCVVSRPKREA